MSADTATGDTGGMKDQELLCDPRASVCIRVHPRSCCCSSPVRVAHRRDKRQRATLFPDAPTENHLHDLLVARCGERRAVAEVELPLRAEVQVRRQEDLVFLLGERIETIDRA